MKTDMTFLAAYLRATSGLVIAEEKEYLVESRLASVVARHGCASVPELVERLKAFPAEDMKRDVVEAMTTNETSFFRDVTPFEMLKKHVLPDLIQRRAGAKRLRILSAAASTGQEAYSIAILLKEYGEALKGWTLDIVGSDIDTTVLKKAEVGEYSRFEVQRGLPVALLVKYFIQTGQDGWRVKPEIRSMVSFRQNNLLHDHPGFGSFDIIFCRNVLIYFDPDVKRTVLTRLARHLAADGHLFLGGAETIIGITDQFALGPARGVYNKVDKPAPQGRAHAA